MTSASRASRNLAVFLSLTFGALALADGIMKEYKANPTLWEVRAAANAARGDFKDAGRDQVHAIEEATALGWDLTLLQKRRDLYGANRSWSGDLLAF